MPAVFLSLGSNLGDRIVLLQQVLNALGKDAGKIVNASSWYETEPVGKISQPWFVNCVAQLRTELAPEQMFAACRAIEDRLGRMRTQRWGPRTADIDILFYGGQIIRTPQLTIPHPELLRRRFVLVPLAQLAPDFIHPEIKKTVRQLLNECGDASIVRRLEHPRTQKTRNAAAD